LLSLVGADQVAKGARLPILVLLGVIGAALLYGDGVITPAISVLSAMEGLKLIAPGFEKFIVPVTLVILIGLFVIQRRGTESIGRLFGPVMVAWFVVIGVLGASNIWLAPTILQAINPLQAARFLAADPIVSFAVIGAVFLALTGGEALYADMGHVGASAIRRAWFGLVLPALILNYFGQGALVISNPATVDNPFYKLAPHILQGPMIVLATIATVIASQAVITGAYSVSRMCVQMGLLPRMEVRHTSELEQGQIYVPQINAILAVGVVLLVLTFRSSNALASAYGIAVTGTFLCDNTLAAFVYRRQFRWPRWGVIALFGAFGVIDFAFFAANSLKIFEGGWVPLAIGFTIILIMTTWRRGRGLMMARWQQDSLPLASFLSRMPQSRIIRVPGTAVFMTGNLDFVPNALLHNLKHNKVLHEQVFFVNVRTLDVPQANPSDRATAEEVSPGIFKVSLCYGFMESPNVPRALERLSAQGIEVKPMQTSYFLGRETVVSASLPKLRFVRRWLFLFMARNSVSATEFFRIPSDRVVELGVRVAI
jgi:KUP system potassium uptake protein